MVSTWRYYSFKDISLMRPRSSLTVILLGSLIYLIWNYSQPVLVACASCYVASGIVIRVGGIVRRGTCVPRLPSSRSIRLASTVLALVGSESLMGREIRDVFAGNTLGQDLKLVAARD